MSISKEKNNDRDCLGQISVGGAVINDDATIELNDLQQPQLV